MVVHKDIMINHPVTSTQPALVTRTGTLKAEASMGSEEEMVRLSKDLGVNEKRGDMTKGNDADNIFMEDVRLTTYTLISSSISTSTHVHF